jgi:molybdopterin converting factor subunit 1
LNLNVRLFGSSKDILGRDQIGIEWKDNMTVGDLRRTLEQRHPSLSAAKMQFAVAVNRKLADDMELIGQTDELAILPPISGG